MNYIYDILLNFNRQLYDFFEWNLSDNIIHVRKIPLFRIDSKTLLTIRDNKVKVDSSFLEKIKNKTEIFTNKDVDVIEYASLLTDGSSVIALKLNHDGKSFGKSTLLVDEDSEVLEVSDRIKELNFSYEILESEIYVPLKTRKEQKMEKFVKEELKKSQKQKDFEKLSYLYFEYFGKTEESIEKIIYQFQRQMKYGNYEMTHKLYDFFKLTSAIK
ncbi:MAG: DUF3603 family protein [Lachnospiraceae bacterium]|nr:DUF3603 family protein [Lachnospiraceae bacterium]